MNVDWTVILTAAISGGLFGSLTNLLLPSMQWRIELKREIRKERKDFINKSFEMLTMRLVEMIDTSNFQKLLSIMPDESTELIHKMLDNFNVNFLESHESEINDKSLIEDGDQLLDDIKAICAAEIYRLQKKWKLI